jgi:NAD(P)H dehydrogenase (quinone)
MPVTRTVVNPPAYLDMLVTQGIPKPVARSLVSRFASRAKGELAKVDPTLEEIVGRPLRTVAEVLPALLAAAGPA